MKAIETKEELDELVQKNKIVVVKFWATWCGPCRMMGPFYESLESKYKEVMFAKVDVEEAADLAEECEICAMPTFHLFKDGVPVLQMTCSNKDTVEEEIKKLIDV